MKFLNIVLTSKERESLWTSNTEKITPTGRDYVLILSQYVGMVPPYDEKPVIAMTDTIGYKGVNTRCLKIIK